MDKVTVRFARTAALTFRVMITATESAGIGAGDGGCCDGEISRFDAMAVADGAGPANVGVDLADVKDDSVAVTDHVVVPDGLRDT